MPDLINAGILRPPAGAPTTPGGQGWVDFWRNQFGQAPRYPMPRPEPGAGRFGYARLFVPRGAPRTGGTDTGSPLAHSTANILRAVRGVAGTPGAQTYANPGAPGQFMFHTLPAGFTGTPIRFQHSAAAGGAPPVVTPPVTPPGVPAGTEGRPAVLGPPAWSPYLLSFMRGYLNP